MEEELTTVSVVEETTAPVVVPTTSYEPTVEATTVVTTGESMKQPFAC